MIIKLKIFSTFFSANVSVGEEIAGITSQLDMLTNSLSESVTSTPMSGKVQKKWDLPQIFPQKMKINE